MKNHKVKSMICSLILFASITFMACSGENKASEKQRIDNNQLKEENENDTPTYLTPTLLPNKLVSQDIEVISTTATIDEIKAKSMAQRFCEDMTLSWLNLKRVDMSDYLVDNLDTHLALKWIDYDIADRQKNTWKQIVRIDSVVLDNDKFENISETKALFKTFADIDYTRYEPSVNGIGIDLTLELELIDDRWMITSVDIIGSSIYRKWKESDYATIEEMDEAFENSCKEAGIQ